jgi:hypothetical protein
MTVARVERDGDAAYFTDAAGECYRVHNVLYREHKKHLVPIESPRANHRYFVSQTGIARAYRFAKLESRVMDPERL